VTSATIVHATLGLLALLLFLEARTHDRRSTQNVETPRPPRHGATIDREFHPELLVRWDDEMMDVVQRPCDRGPAADARTARHRGRLTRLAERCATSA